MKKKLLLFTIPWLLNAQTIDGLFNALKNHSQTKADEVLIKKSEVQKNIVKSALFPKIDIFSSYDHYNTPTSLIPVTPNESAKMLKNQTIPQPFSNNILKAGVKFSMPIYVKAIYTMAQKAQIIQKSLKLKKEIDLLKNEALIVSANANLLYLKSLKKALQAKEYSIIETKKTIEIKVNNGRLPASALYKINDSLNEIIISKNNIDLQKQKLISQIETLTGIVLTSPIKMTQINSFKKDKLKSLEPLIQKLKADNLKIKAQKEKLYPTFSLHGSYVYSQADAYNNDKSINEHFANIGISVNFPLFDKSKRKEVNLAKVEAQTQAIEIQKLKDELSAQANMLENSLKLLNHSLTLYKNSIANKEKLLNIAKVSYESGRMSTEEYLRYEDAVVAQKANLYKTQATKWQTIMQLAVIYANNIEEIVK